MANRFFKKIETKIKKSPRWAKLGQFAYLTIHGFNKCNLWESAYSCSFGFVFSFIPILLIIISILSYVLQASPGAVGFVLNFAEQIKNIYDITPIVDIVLKGGPLKFTVVDVVLTIWIFWMARKMFLSINYAMNRIFRSRSRRKTTRNQAVILLSEIILIIVVVIIIIFSFVFNKFISLPVFEPIKDVAPVLFSNSSNNLVKVVIYMILFIAITLIYRFVSGTAPKLRNCMFFAFLNTLCFFVLSWILNKFYVTTNYNLIYGTISTLIIMMAKVYFFFVIFLYGAEMLYIQQFFDALIRAEVYLRPDSETHNFSDLMRKVLFINAAALQTDENIRFFKAGDVIYKKGDSPDFVYYVCSGILKENNDSTERLVVEGAFIGDIACILNKKRQMNLTAVKDCKLMFFTNQEFQEFLKENSKAAAKALRKVAQYSERYYQTGYENDEYNESEVEREERG